MVLLCKSGIYKGLYMNFVIIIIFLDVVGRKPRSYVVNNVWIALFGRKF